MRRTTAKVKRKIYLSNKLRENLITLIWGYYAHRLFWKPQELELFEELGLTRDLRKRGIFIAY